MINTLSTTKPSLKTQIDDFVSKNADVIGLFSIILLLIGVVSYLGIQNTNQNKLSRGMYIEANFERFFEGKITLEDIEILNKFGETNDLMKDWRYYRDQVGK